jgi:hypothetical protein
LRREERCHVILETAYRSLSSKMSFLLKEKGEEEVTDE